MNNMTQRTIKFRAWDSTYGSMHPSDDLGISLDGKTLYFDSNISNGVAGFVKFTGRETDRFELMQFTGLLDKNGKEIYEGDILRGWEADGVFVRKGEVYLDQARFMVKLKGVPRHLKTLARKYEIIGNIYENPELIKN